MAEYIEREALLKTISELMEKEKEQKYINSAHYAIRFLHVLIQNTLAADVQEVRHGEWILKSELHPLFDDVDEKFYVECPFCRRTFYVRFELTEADMLKYAKEKYPYCNCGAKMNGKGSGGNA